MNADLQDAPEKAFWQSKTFQGLFAVLLAQILKRWGLDVMPAELMDFIEPTLTYGGLMFAAYGRVKARHTLKLTKPGGPFNPNAEVRRAEPVTPSKAPITRGGGNNKGHALAKFLACLVMVFLLVAAIVAVESLRAQEPTSCGGRPYSEWIGYATKVDKRPFLVRLAESIRFTFEAKPVYDVTNGLSLTVTKAQIKGGTDF
ncbi:hypothetical protein BH09VER1_BH09VER1_24740 [soil metagenome]